MIFSSAPGTRNPELKVLLIMSSPGELRPFLRLVRHRRTVFQGLQAWNFQGRRYAGLALLVGMGGSAPRLLTEQAVASCSPHWVCNAGFGGAITPLPPPGGIILSSQCWHLTRPLTLSRVDFQPVAPLAELTSLLQSRGLPAYAGALLTTPVLMAKASLPSQAFRLPHPVLDLETAQVAAVAQAHQLPFLAVRAVTDGAGEEIQDFLADLVNTYQDVPLSRVLAALCADPRRVLYCLHLRRRSRLAAANLAQALDLIFHHLTSSPPNLQT